MFICTLQGFSGTRENPVKFTAKTFAVQDFKCAMCTFYHHPSLSGLNNHKILIDTIFQEKKEDLLKSIGLKSNMSSNSGKHSGRIEMRKQFCLLLLWQFSLSPSVLLM